MEGNILDLAHRKQGFGQITILDGKIQSLRFYGPVQKDSPYYLPGFIDAHIHIESSMVTPPAFAATAVRHGTVATVSDPHEIANVCGIEGVKYMADAGKRSGFNFFFGAPSCVPATSFETAGAELSVFGIRELFAAGDVTYLSEMMNYPAVLRRDPLVMDKIMLAQEYGFPVDGHAPGLRGDDALQYAKAGISTDHECTTLEEALDKITAGMKIIIREGSAAKNFDALHPLIASHPDSIMFCSDDKHPDDLVKGHIRDLVLRSLHLGYDIMDVLSIACIHPVMHYRLASGTLREGDQADLIMVKDLDSFHVLGTWIQGKQVFDGQNVFLPQIPLKAINAFNAKPVSPDSLSLITTNNHAKIIKVIDGSIVTESMTAALPGGNMESDVDHDILKIVVVNRYAESKPAIALIHGFSLIKGALASSVAHDSHNIVAVGTNDMDLANCINLVIQHHGGIAAVCSDEQHCIPLPVAGLMSLLSAEEIAVQYETIDHFVKKELGSTLSAPFMTLSFMALLVIPSLKLSDKGLFDANIFELIPLQKLPE